MIAPKMPSGRTHDAVTWFLAAPVGYAAWVVAHDPVGAALAAGAFTFAGLMFSGDLDLPSSQYYRWGKLRWIWRPYQWLVPHRSVLSHGLLAGPVVRLAYLTALAAALGALATWAATGRWAFPWAGVAMAADVAVRLDGQQWAWLAYAVVGMWLGAASHSLADWGGSAVRRWLR